MSYVFTYHGTGNLDFLSWVCAGSDALSKTPGAIPGFGLLLLGFCAGPFIVAYRCEIFWL